MQKRTSKKNSPNIGFSTILELVLAGKLDPQTVVKPSLFRDAMETAKKSSEVNAPRPL